MNMCPVIFDCDGVLLDWELGFRLWVEKSYPAIQFTGEHPESWDLSEWIGCDRERALALISEFNRSEAFGELLPMPYAARTLYEVERIGHPIYVLTSCSSDELVRVRRMVNLFNCFNTEIQRTICLDLGVPKLEILKAFYAVFGQCIWIEDNFKNAIDGDVAGHQSFFLRRPHNEVQWKKATEGLIHLDHLRDLVSIIK